MKIHEECGVFGVMTKKPADVAMICYYGLYALQHRCQESCGIVINDDGIFHSHKDLGLVSEVFTKEALSRLPKGRIAVAHARYGTTGAAIMTDTSIADKVYMEPLTPECIAKIVRKERPDAILPGIGGQTRLNLAMQLEKKGVLAECRTELLGTKSRSIEQAEDRELFKELCLRLGEPVLPSEIACSMEEGLQAALDIGYPVVLRPAFTLGGTGGGFADSEEEFLPIMKNALALSPVSQVLIEKSVKGFKEIEYEVIRDRNDTAITICNMENMDPVGIHTGDSIVVSPSQTLTNKEYHMLRDSALRVIRALLAYVRTGTDDRILAIAQLLRREDKLPQRSIRHLQRSIRHLLWLI